MLVARLASLMLGLVTYGWIIALPLLNVTAARLDVD